MNKKNVLFFSLLIFCVSLYAQKFQIVDIEYDLAGCGPKILGVTNQYALEQKVSVDKKTIFESEEEFNKYFEEYKKQINNLRAFEKIEISYSILNQENDINHVKIHVILKDSIHILAVPYLKYDSNKGFTFKLKAKDTNFLGSLNSMSTDLNFAIENNEELGTKKTKIGFNFNYDYPFSLGLFNSTWVNDFEFSYAIGEKIPEWYAKTGLKLELPKDDYSYLFEVYQYSIHDTDYIDFNDEYYFSEEAKFSVPITLAKLDSFGKVIYKPYTSFIFNWDFNHINETNSDLSSPTFTLGHTLNLGKTDWIGNYRRGISLSLLNSYNYNIQRNDFYPKVSLEMNAFYNLEFFEGNYFNKMGLCSYLYLFHYFNLKQNKFSYNEKIGSKLRGIRDEQYFSPESGVSSLQACNTSSAIVLNLDFPYHIFSTNFTKSFLRYFNFDLQISPFIDIALVNNKATQKTFDLKDGFYAAGFEVLVYPQKWSSFTVRGSLGIDIGRTLLKDYINTQWRDNVSKYEISFGVGLHY